jgi:hypothetical protein
MRDLICECEAAWAMDAILMESLERLYTTVPSEHCILTWALEKMTEIINSWDYEGEMSGAYHPFQSGYTKVSRTLAWINQMKNRK